MNDWPTKMGAEAFAALHKCSPVRVDSYTMVRGTVCVPLTVPGTKFSMGLQRKECQSRRAN
jgi:hypothetical protein